MRHEELADENCAIARTSAIVGERWVWLILRQAFNGAHRFEEFQRGMGVARNILADRMNKLIEEGVLEKQPIPASPTRSEYRLTAKGRALFPAYVALMEWGNEWTGLAAPPVDLLHKPCRHRTNPVLVCDHCGEAIDARDTEPVVGRGMILAGKA